MKEAKPYIICGVIVLLVLGLKLNTWSSSYGSVDEFRGANLQEDVFYPLIARNINDDKKLVVTLNGETIANQFGEVRVSKDKHIMFSLDFVRDQLDISASYYDENTALIIYNGKKEKLDLLTENNIDYVVASDLCEVTGYTCDANIDEYKVDISTNKRTSVLPQEYDLRDYDRVPEAMNQGSESTCWAYASILALDSSVLPREAAFDVEGMIESYAEVSNNNAGGAFTNALAYLLSWNGPTENGNSTVQLTGNDADVVKHVQEARFYTHQDIDEIKWAVYKFGGVSTSVYANVANSNLNKSNYYNIKTNSYCYNGTNGPNHEITIIGWDDNYSASNFDVAVKGNGAFICQNSWGKTFGDGGVFYVSYYDTNVGTQAVSYSRVMDKSYYDNIYQADLCGWKGQIGYGQNNALAASIYTTKSQERLQAVGLYAIDKSAKVNVYLVRDYDNTNSLVNRELVATREFDTAGYYTIELDHPVELNKGEKFAIVIDMNIPGAQRPIAIEYKVDNDDKLVRIDDGEGYISKDGTNWESVEDKAAGNLCIKAYTTDVED